MKKKNILFTILVLLTIITITILFSKKEFQNDTFYTIKVGESIIKNGLDMKDHFSWIEGLSYTYPHFLYDIIIYGLYSLGGLTLIYISNMVLCFTLLLLMYCFSKKITGNKYLSFVLLAIMPLGFSNLVTARAQLISTILLLIIIYLIEKIRTDFKKKYLFLIFLSSWLVALMHSAVWPMIIILYLPYIVQDLIYLMNNKFKFKFIKNYNVEIEQSCLRNTMKSFLVCFITGFMTPNFLVPFTYFYNIRRGISMNYIGEHTPTTISFSKVLFIFLLFIIIFLLNKKNRIKLKDLFMICGLFLLSLLSIRNVAFFFIFTIFAFSRMIKGKRTVELEFVLNHNIFKITMIIVLAGLSFLIAVSKQNVNYINESEYPTKACDYIVNNLDYKEMRIYNEYNFGSYLIFRGIPVFIDSRSDLYLEEFNEGVTIFKDAMDQEGQYEEIFDKYFVTHILIKNNSYLNQTLKVNDKYNVLYTDDYFTLYEITGKNLFIELSDID